MSATNDVTQAIEAAWTAGNLASSVPGGLHAVPLATKRPLSPYATLEVTKDARANLWTTGAAYIDYRRVKVILYGVGQTALGTVVSKVLLAIWKNGANYIALAIPNATWMRTEYLSDDIKLEEPVAGDDVRSGPMEFCIWSQRTAG
jgi:hypothetical protein